MAIAQWASRGDQNIALIQTLRAARDEIQHLRKTGGHTKWDKYDVVLTIGERIQELNDDPKTTKRLSAFKR